jgi:hypothetical protein
MAVKRSVSGTDVTLTWSSVEGSTYVLATSTNLAVWTTNSLAAVTAIGILTQATETVGATGRERRCYRVQRTGVAPYAN